MSPIAEHKYLSVMSQKNMLYDDILFFQILNVGSGQNVNNNLANGVSRIRSILIVPQLSASVNGSTVLGSYIAGQKIGAPMNSPFSSSSGTCCPHAIVSNFNIQLSGSPVFQSSFQYGWEHYLNEVRGSNSLNGGVPMVLCSGLLDQQKWENGYRQMRVDLSSHSSAADDDRSRSVSVFFTNLSPTVIDYYVFITFQREFNLSTSTRALIA